MQAPVAQSLKQINVVKFSTNSALCFTIYSQNYLYLFKTVTYNSQNSLYLFKTVTL